VREYVAPVEGGEMSTAQLEALKRDVEAKKSAMDVWCRTAFGEVSAACVTVCVRL
jgi:V-type H+-transporting ATPase subunit C